MASLYPDIRLLSITPALRRDLDGPALAFYEAHRARVGDVADRVRALVAQTLDGGHEGFLVVESALARVVGICGYKGPARDVVEIAYGIFPPYEGRGYATAAAAALIARASGARVIRAHTLPERNASCRVLEKNGLAFVGEIEDPEDGRVWRWERSGE
jgi:RimJ/RimL family protein N-acetyltransferase